MIWFHFALCAAVILYCGSGLSRYAELIAEKSGLSKGWIGLILLSLVTSLPELVSSLSATVRFDLPDMAVSGLIGACMFNAMLIGLLDVASPDAPVSYKVHEGHLLSAGFCIILMGFIAIDILFGKHLPVLSFLNSMDPITVLFVPVYLIAMKLAFQFEKARLQAYTHEKSQTDPSSRSWLKILVPFIGSAIGITIASYYLPETAQEIAARTGWGESFMGSSFIAITTCLPEFIVSFSAARQGSFDMAVASLLGSNLCNIVILAINDFCYPKEALLRHVSVGNTLAALTAIISMGIVVIGLTYRAKRKFVFLAGDAIALIYVYVFANMMLFIAH